MQFAPLKRKSSSQRIRQTIKVTYNSLRGIRASPDVQCGGVNLPASPAVEIEVIMATSRERNGMRGREEFGN
jgi:hypothetical protein